MRNYVEKYRTSNYDGLGTSSLAHNIDDSYTAMCGALV